MFEGHDFIVIVHTFKIKCGPVDFTVIGRQIESEINKFRIQIKSLIFLMQKTNYFCICKRTSVQN